MEDGETVTIGTEDIGVLPADHAAEFEGCKPLKGAEHLGRAIVDKNGFPSGSPANYETLRVATVAEEQRLAKLEAGPTPEDIAAAVGSAIEASATTE